VVEPSVAETAAESASTGQEQIVLTNAESEDPPMMVVARMSSSGGKHWGISLGTFGDQYSAQKVLTKIQLSQSGILGDSLRKIAKTSQGYDATFLGLTQEQAEVACGRLTAREVSCSAFGP
jgi:D-alanyl-D-alanine carboxypeptidase